MPAYRGLVKEFEDAISEKPIGHRIKALRRITDLFASGAMSFTDDQIELFDDVMGRLAKEVDQLARIAFSTRLATLPNAPINTSRTLALDDSVDIAGPILAKSDRLHDDTLVEGAKTKSQLHLLAITKRQTLPEVVTDVLVERGNQEVVRRTAENRGAKFSDAGISTLVKRAGADNVLALCIWLRPDIPRHHLLRLLSDASETVKQQFQAIDPRKAKIVKEMVGHAGCQMQAEVRKRSSEFNAALAHVQGLHTAGKLKQDDLAAFAIAGKFDQTSIALSLMCDLPVGVIEQALVSEKCDQILVLAKGISLAWDTTRAIVLLNLTCRHRTSADLHEIRTNYLKLPEGAARKAVEFYRLRERAAGSPAN
jgi:uncharacterized protein (DUF2336 family)